MQNTQKMCQKICKPVWNMQNTDRSIFCIFVIVYALPGPTLLMAGSYEHPWPPLGSRSRPLASVRVSFPRP